MADNLLVYPQRSEQMKLLLTKLKEEDVLWYQHIPEETTSRMPDFELNELIERIYAQREFRVERPLQVKHIVQIGDRIEMAHDYKELNWGLYPGMQGYTRSKPEQNILDEDNRKVNIKFYGIPKERRISIQDLRVLGEEGLFLDTLYPEPKAGVTVGNCRNWQLVEYRGQPIEDIKLFVPVGSSGIVRGHHPGNSAGHELAISWERSLSIIGYEMLENKYFGYQDITLFCKNGINLAALKEKVTQSLR